MIKLGKYFNINTMSLFSRFFHHISFSQVDPLDNGLREEILAEQAEPQAIRTLEDEDGASLISAWEEMSQGLHDGE